MEHSEILTIFATSKGSLWLSGQNPEREQDFIDTTPFFIAKGAFLTIRAESREGKTLSTLPKRGEHFMLTSCFLYPQPQPNRLVTNLRYQADL